MLRPERRQLCPFALRQEIPARSVGKGIGHFFGAMQIDGFIDKDEFRSVPTLFEQIQLVLRSR